MVEKNPGHDALVADLKALLADAEAMAFDDFANREHAFPKVALVRRLEALVGRAKTGDYDQ